MKNKNIKNKPEKCGRWFFLHLDFPKFSGGVHPKPPYKEIHQLNPQNLSSTTTAAKGKKKAGKPPPPTPTPIKIIYKKIIFRLYRN